MNNLVNKLKHKEHKQHKKKKKQPIASIVKPVPLYCPQSIYCRRYSYNGDVDRSTKITFHFSLLLILAGFVFCVVFCLSFVVVWFTNRERMYEIMPKF